MNKGCAIVAVTREVEITYDRDKFTPEFMAEFRESFYNFHTIEDHLQHIATCYVRGLVSGPSDFLEGYGKLSDFGVKLRTMHGR